MSDDLASRARAKGSAALRGLVEDGTIDKLVKIQAKYQPRPIGTVDETNTVETCPSQLRSRLLGANPDPKSLKFRGVSTFHLSDIGPVNWSSDLAFLNRWFSTYSTIDYTKHKKLFGDQCLSSQWKYLQAAHKYTSNSSARALETPAIVEKYKSLIWHAVNHLLGLFGTDESVFGLLGESSPFLGTARILTESYLYEDAAWTSQICRSAIALDGAPAIRYSSAQNLLILYIQPRHGFPFNCDLKFGPSHFVDRDPPDLPPPPYRFPIPHLDIYDLDNLSEKSQKRIVRAAKWILRAAVIAAESLPSRFSKNMFELSVAHFTEPGLLPGTQSTGRGSKDVKDLLRLTETRGRWVIEANISALHTSLDIKNNIVFPLLGSVHSAGLAKAKRHLQYAWHSSAMNILETLTAMIAYIASPDDLPVVNASCDHDKKDGLHFCAHCDNLVPCAQISGDSRAICSDCITNATVSDLDADTFVLDSQLITTQSVAMDRFGLHPETDAQAQFIHNAELKIVGFLKKARKAVVQGNTTHIPLVHKDITATVKSSIEGGLQENLFNLGSLEILRSRYPKCRYFSPTIIRNERVFVDSFGGLHLIHYRDISVTINAFAVMKMESSTVTLKLLLKSMYMRAIGYDDSVEMDKIDRTIDQAEASNRQIPHENRHILRLPVNEARMIRNQLVA